MDEECESIPISMDESEVAQLFERHNWISAPVVDDNAHLLGRITIDDIVDVIREDAEHSLLSLAGLDDEEDTFAPVLKSSKKRSIWLGVNLLTALLAAIVASFFENTLAILPILAVLNGIVPSMGGVAGSQTLTLVIRGIAVGHINQTNQRFLLLKELAIGAINGMVWSILIAGVVALWQWDFKLGGVLAFAMFMTAHSGSKNDNITSAPTCRLNPANSVNFNPTREPTHPPNKLVRIPQNSYSKNKNAI